MKIQDKIRKKVLAGLYDFQMLTPNDKVLVAISGGKDSLVMLDMLKIISKYNSYGFELIPVYVIPEVPNIQTFQDKLKDYFIQKGFENHIIQKMKFKKDSKLPEGIRASQTCQWCSYSRRIALFKIAEKIQATKIAYGHHMDDIVNTLFMNIHIGRRFDVMLPVNPMRKGDFSIIRPLVYVREDEIARYCKRENIQPLKSHCPLEKDTKREEIKIVLQNIEQSLPNFVEDFFRAYIAKKGKNNLND